ncbi:aldo/keto reductase family oxidoreductase [Paenibacillus pinisoli]|uniref:Aldo/keto reductase family oxidoreductase n=1 Tax=Paenibacillus pinisoli TaxID=1276110 RepID=A0A3A6PC45_9BACL|nr:aldo/keto reductase [Paenibacillus pinisoli]RJX38097.1 aldo/keto reductase family oxidoreductase [Paenibacillus pinisoli]
MKFIDIAGTDLRASNIIMGNMRLKQLSLAEAEKLIRTAIEQDINFFDHADIYGAGSCEEHFSEAVGMTPSLRETMILQSKCGIRKGFFDFSKEHIIASTDGILKRLNTDYLDILLLHRPDTLVEPEEVAEAFNELHASGKVRHFGVSNHTPMQIELLQKYVPHKLIVNQMQLSATHTPMIDSGIALNMNIDQSVNRDSGVLDYCRLNNITIQAWSPFQKAFFDGPFLGDLENYPELNKLIDSLADQYGVTATAIAVAWITRHPANIQVVLGTTNAGRLQDACQGSDIKLTREEWYGIYTAAGHILP